MLHDYVVLFGNEGQNFLPNWKSISEDIIAYAKCDKTLSSKASIKKILNSSTVTGDQELFVRSKPAVALGKILGGYQCVPSPRTKKPNAPKAWHATAYDVKSCFVNWHEVKI